MIASNTSRTGVDSVSSSFVTHVVYVHAHQTTSRTISACPAPDHVRSVRSTMGDLRDREHEHEVVEQLERRCTLLPADRFGSAETGSSRRRLAGCTIENCSGVIPARWGSPMSHRPAGWTEDDSRQCPGAAACFLVTKFVS